MDVGLIECRGVRQKSRGSLACPQQYLIRSVRWIPFAESETGKWSISFEKNIWGASRYYPRKQGLIGGRAWMLDTTYWQLIPWVTLFWWNGRLLSLGFFLPFLFPSDPVGFTCGLLLHIVYPPDPDSSPSRFDKPIFCCGFLFPPFPSVRLFFSLQNIWVLRSKLWYNESWLSRTW